MRYNNYLVIEGQRISLNAPTYFIADIASNHDGDINRAIDLIGLAKDAGADAVKFQHFQAAKIVSDYGFKNLGQQVSHQSGWKKTVYEIYQQYECRLEWTQRLIQAARAAGIHFFTTPYDRQVLEEIGNVPAYKIGSGDITWIEFIEEIAQRERPVILSTGASTLEDVERAVHAVLKYNDQIALLQCNTNYTGNIENFHYINLRVLQAFAIYFPNMVLGLSDHTPGCSAVLGAIALGARIIEKHFTDDQNREGPDHAFSINPEGWREMVIRSRELEAALGDGIKRVEENEKQTVVIQRRCLRLVHDMAAGETINREDLEALRPAPEDSAVPYLIDDIVGQRLKCDKKGGEALMHGDWEERIC